jgi:hypothetical protein
MTDKPFYRFFAIDYCATGEGRSFFLTICRNYQKIDGRDREYERFAKFVDCDYYMECFEELTEEEFLDKYDVFIPLYVKAQVKFKDQPAFTWETQLHINYS